MDGMTGGFQAAHASGGGWRDMTEACLGQLAGAADGANLGFVYVTDALDGDLQSIVDALSQRTAIRDWIGTVGFGVCASGVEYFDMPAMVLLVGALPADAFCVLPTVEGADDGLPPQVADWVGAHTPMLGVVHGDPRNPELERVLESVQSAAGCFLVGGLTASRGSLDQVAGAVTRGGVSGVLFSGATLVATGLTQGCSPIGAVHEVTEGRDNVLATIDNRPAFEVFKEEIGELLARDLSKIEGYVHVALPIAGSDTGDYVVRNLLGVDPEKGHIAIADRVATGDRVMFVRRDGTSAMADLKRMLADVKRRAGTQPKAALYFSCIARGPNLFGAGSVELGTIAEALGEVPLAGFFANGEISNSRLYGYTGVIALFL